MKKTDYKNEIKKMESLNQQLIELRKDFIKQVFDENGDTIGLPKWMHCLSQYDDTMYFDNIYVSYNHDGAWIRPFSMTRKEGETEGTYRYFIDGCENEEYAQEWVDDCEVYNIGNVAQFLIDYLESGFEEILAELVKSVVEQHSMSDVYIVIEEWCDKYGYDYEDLDADACFEWCGKQIENNK